MKVHFASGTHPFPEPWVNVDAYATEGNPRKVDLTKPFPDWLDHVELAYVGHFLEHLRIDDAVVFLERVRERMTDDGSIVVVGPDVERAQAMHTRGMVPAHIVEACRAHIADGEGNSHLWDCTADLVHQLLDMSGWGHIWEHAPYRLPFDVPVIDGSLWQFALSAKARTDD